MALKCDGLHWRRLCSTATTEAHLKVGQGVTPRRLNPKRCRYFSLEKFEDAFDTALDLTKTKPSDAALSFVFFERRLMPT